MLFKNTFKPTVRHLLRDKIYLVVSVLSLSAGLICCLFVFKYVQNELSYDRFHEDAERIFRIEIEVYTEDGASSRYAFLGTSPVDWLDTVPEIELETRFARYAGDMSIEVKGESFAESNMIAADSTFFKQFSFGLIEGDAASALTTPGSVVISQSTAYKYFGEIDITGETLAIHSRDRKEMVTITGVARDVPSNSHFSFDLVTSADVYEQVYEVDIQNFNNAYSYIRASRSSSLTELEEKINELYEHHSPETASVSRFHLQEMTDIHLHSSALGELALNGSATYVYLFTLVVFIIIGIACVNFATLATARSVRRTREMAVRKVFGADKSSLMTIFLVESVLLSFTGLLFAYLLAYFLLPYFNLIAGQNFSFTSLLSQNFLLLMVGVTILTGIASSLYPAVILSRKKVRFLLEKDVASGLRGDLLWKSMVVSQFVISMVLIGATYVVQKQIAFVLTKDLGFDKEQIITIPNYFGREAKTFIEQLEQHPNIERVTTSTSIPGINKSIMNSSVEAEGSSGSMTFDVNIIDHNFLYTYNIPIIQGRNFSAELASDSTQAFILNQAAVETLGWSDPLGKFMYAWGRDGYVIGIVKDFHIVSLHNEIAPTVFLTYGHPFGELSVKIHSAQQLLETLSFIEDQWKELLPGTPFAYNFIDDQFAAVYESEQRARSLFFSFSVLAVIIASLGLFSFASFSMQQKTREIGIRKVMGASVYDILRLFYSGYARLLIIAACIALPAGFIWMRAWLQNFSYRTEIGPDVFAVPLVLALIILIVSVSWQAVKGAGRNPVDSIRVE